MLKELEELDGKLINIIKSAKRFMPDVGYHFGDDYDKVKFVYSISSAAISTEDLNSQSLICA